MDYPLRVPGAAQHEVVRCRPGTVPYTDRSTHRLRNDPGAAVHRFAPARTAPHPDTQAIADPNC
jgi:hypothetical protein